MINEERERKKVNISDIIVMILPFTKRLFKRWPWISQAMNFAAVGGINLVVSSLIYTIFVIFFHPQIANFIAFWTSVTVGYLFNRFWVFQEQVAKRSHRQMVRYYMLYAFNFLLGIALTYLYNDVLHLNKFIFPYISIPITIPMNYLINKFWVFKEDKHAN